MSSKINLCLLTVCLLAGCASETTSKFTPIQGGFGYVTHVEGTIDQSLSASFCYKDTNGTTTVIWPSLSIINGDNPVIGNNTAFFVGGIASLYKDGNERLSDRLMAFKGPSGPPMDITDQVLQRYYAGTSFGLTNFMRGSFVSITQTNNLIQIGFVSAKIRPGTKNIWDSFDSTFTISWNEIDAIIQDVKINGKLKKEKWSGFEYLRKD